MEKDFIPYEEALALKELGFDEPCYKYIYIGDTGINVDHYLEVEPSKARNYNEDSLCISQPTFSQAFRWFRDNHGLVSWISFRIDLKKKYLWYITDVKNIATRDGDYIFDILIESYEDAELACLKKLIVLLKSNEQR